MGKYIFVEDGTFWKQNKKKYEALYILRNGLQSVKDFFGEAPSRVLPPLGGCAQGPAMLYFADFSNF